MRLHARLCVAEQMVEDSLPQGRDVNHKECKGAQAGAPRPLPLGSTTHTHLIAGHDEYPSTGASHHGSRKLEANEVEDTAS